MKNRNIQFKPTAGLLIPLFLACFAAVFISAPTPAAAHDMVPFNGTVLGSALAMRRRLPNRKVAGLFGIAHRT